MTSQELTTKIKAVEAVLMTPDSKRQLAQMLPPEIPVDRFARAAVMAVQNNPDLLNKDRGSLYNAVRRCAQDGLMPDGREAALVAFGNQVQYMPMVGGLRKVAAKYGVNIASGVVYENDFFEYELGVQPTKTHKPPKLGEDRGKAIGAWAEAIDKSGQLYLEVMSTSEVEKIRAISRAKSSGPWVNQWGEMARKTVVRRLWKSLPLYNISDQDARVGNAAMDPEFEEFPPEDPAAEPANPSAAPTSTRTSRPSVLQRVVNAAGGEDVVDTRTGEVNPPEATDEVQVAEPVDESPRQRAADDYF